MSLLHKEDSMTAEVWSKLQALPHDHGRDFGVLVFNILRVVHVTSDIITPIHIGEKTVTDTVDKVQRLACDLGDIYGDRVYVKIRRLGCTHRTAWLARDAAKYKCWLLVQQVINKWLVSNR